MTLSGKQLIDAAFIAAGTQHFGAFNPGAEHSPLPEAFFEATKEEVDRAAQSSAAAFLAYSSTSGAQKAEFLEAIAEEIMHAGDALLERANAETGLPMARLQGERGRTTGQLKLFANLLREGSWVNAIIDTAEPERVPAPKPEPVKPWQAEVGELLFWYVDAEGANGIASGRGGHL